MKKSLRILLLLTPLIIIGLAHWEKGRWEPPLNPNIPQPVSIGTLLAHNESYKEPMLLITHGTVHNNSGNVLYLKSGDNYLKVNCTFVNTSTLQEGMMLYMRGYSYYHDPSKEYFVAVEIHIHTSYSVHLSIPIAIVVLIILFVGFKFRFADFSFSRREEENEPDA